MSQSIILFLSFAAISVLLLRGIMALLIRDAMSQSERKRYRGNCSAMKRWFFLSTHAFLRDKYSKSEERLIRYSFIAKEYCVINIAIHLSFVVTAITMILHRSDDSDYALSMISIAYLLLWGCAVLSLVITETITRRKYHRSRYPW